MLLLLLARSQCIFRRYQVLKSIFKFIFFTGLFLGCIAAFVGFVVSYYFYNKFTRDLPRIEKLSDYQPLAVTTFFAEDGRLLAEVFKEGMRRYPVKFEEIPILVRHAFLAAEDADFYHHPGIDFKSVLRAAWVNFRHHETVQGASTITQQVVKLLLLSKEKTYERKVKEAILSYRLEKALTKNEIFSIYLNEIDLGSHAYGVKAAARVHFHKEMNELNIAEAAFLAALPKKPGELSRRRKRPEALNRQRWVLDQMVQKGMITRDQQREAAKTELVFYHAERRFIPETSYFTSYALDVLAEQLARIDPKISPEDPGGFQVYTTADVGAHRIAIRALQRGVCEVDKRRGWRGPLTIETKGKEAGLLEVQARRANNSITPEEIYSGIVKNINLGSGMAEVQVGEESGLVDLKKATWAQKLIDREDNSRSINLLQYIKPGHVIEVSLDANASDKQGASHKQSAPDIEKGASRKGKIEKLQFQLDQTPELEGAFVLINPLTGAVKVIIGGYNDQQSLFSFNRATQSLRQPGSAFKPFVYLSAIDNLHYTPTTIVPDSPISLVAGNGKLWSPGNFDHKYWGPIPLRRALEHSRNVVSVYLITRLGVQRVIDTARKLGITTNIGHDMSISLGTSEVKLIELVQAYGTFASGGWLADPLIITKVLDRNGKVVLENRTSQKQVMSEESAFLMANMMKGVVERGTATVVKKLEKPVAGKTGTTNEQMDAWFVGYTPEWAAGAWVGFDKKRLIGRMETGGRVAAPIFLYFMQEFLANTPALDFEIPEGVVPVWINASSGHPTDPSTPGAFLEYFKTGTEPTYQAEAPKKKDADVPKDYLSSDEF